MSDHAIAVGSLIVGGVSAVAAIVALLYAHFASEARETEHHDVFWEGDWDPQQPGRYLLRKRGDAEAINVRARVTLRRHVTEVDVLAALAARSRGDY